MNAIRRLVFAICVVIVAPIMIFLWLPITIIAILYIAGKWIITGDFDDKPLEAGYDWGAVLISWLEIKIVP